MNDLDLLRQTKAGDAAALASLAQRHYGWLYAAARRQVGDAHLAEDVAQAVFIVLMQKPPRLETDSSLSAWLFTVVRFAAKRALRSHRRRMHHENRAAAARTEQSEASSEQIAWMEIQMHLDDAVSRLNQADREAVLLRFYQDRRFVEVGSAMGISEDAARKRVERALVRLRDRLSRRGVSVSAAALGPGLLKVLAGASAMKAPAIAYAGTPSSMLAKGVIHMIWTAQAKLGSAILIAALLTAGTTAVVVTKLQSSTSKSAPASAPTVGASSSSPTSAPSGVVSQNGQILPSDLLEIGIMDLQQLGTNTKVISRVDPQLRVHLPFVKLVGLAGTTLPQAESRISKAYESGGFLRNAAVTVRRLESGASPSIPSAPIQSGDALRVTIDDLEKVGTTTEIVKPVSPDGKVQLPLVGAVLVKSLTEAQADEAVAKAYEAQGFMTNAVVSVLRISQEEAARSTVPIPRASTTNPALK